MSSTKNSSKRKNIQDNSEISSRKRQKVSESIPTGGNDNVNHNASTSKGTEFKTVEKSIKLEIGDRIGSKGEKLEKLEKDKIIKLEKDKIIKLEKDKIIKLEKDDKIGLKTKKHSKRVKGNENTKEKDFSDKKLVSKITATEKKLINKIKIDENITGKNNSKKDKEKKDKMKKCNSEGSVKKAIIQNAVVYDDSNDIDDTQLPVELSLSEFIHIHMYIPSQSKDSLKSKPTKDKMVLSSTKNSLPLSPSKSLRNIRCIETKNLEEKKVISSKVNNKRISKTDLNKPEKLDKNNPKDKLSKSKKVKASLDNTVKSSMDNNSTSSSCDQTTIKPVFSESLKVTDSEGEKRIKSDFYKSAIQKKSPKTSNRTTSKKTIIQTESRTVPISHSKSENPIALGIDVSVSQCVTKIPQTFESPSSSKMSVNLTLPSNTPNSNISDVQTLETDTFDEEDKISSSDIVSADENFVSKEAVTDKHLKILDVSNFVECKSSPQQKDVTFETSLSKNAMEKSTKSSSVTDEIKSLKTDTILKEVLESPLTKDKRSSNKPPKDVAITSEISQNDVWTTKVKEKTEPSSGGLSIANSVKNNTKSSELDATVIQASEFPLPKDEISSSINSAMTISNKLDTLQSNSPASVTKSSEIVKPPTSSVSKGNNKTNKTVMSTAKSSKPDKPVQANKSLSSQKKGNSSIKLPKDNSNAEQNDSLVLLSNTSKITESLCSEVLDTNSVTSKAKFLKPDASIKQAPESPATQNEKNSSIKCSAPVSNILETCQSSSTINTKSSEDTKHCKTEGTKTKSRINKTQSSKPDGSSMEVIETQSTKENDSSLPDLTAISDTSLTSKCKESPLIRKLSDKQNKVTENKTKILKLDTSFEPNTESPLIQGENSSSIKHPTVIPLDNSQTNISTFVTKSSEIDKPCTSATGKVSSTANKTTRNKDKSSKPDESDKKPNKLLSPKDKNDSSNNKLATTTSKNNEISSNDDSNLTVKSSKSTISNSTGDEKSKNKSSNIDSNLTVKSSKSTKSDSDEKIKISINITKSSKSEMQVPKSSLPRNKIISPIKPPKKATSTVESPQTINNKEEKITSANTKKKITCSTIPCSSDEPKKVQSQAHSKMSKLDFTNIVLLTDERDNDLKNIAFPCMKWIIKKDMSPVTAFNYIKEHFRSEDYKGKTLYILMCGIKSLYDIGQDYNMCDQYNCKYPIRYWELAGQNARFASNRLIENSRKLKEKVKMVSNKKDDIVFSGIVPICLQNIFVSDVKEHGVWSPYHHIPNDETVHAALHQLDIIGWKGIIFYNEWASKVTSELGIQWDIEKDHFSNNTKQKHFMKGKTLDKDGYRLCKTAVNIRREKLMDAVKKCLTKMGIENPSNNLKKHESIKSQNKKDTNNSKKDEPKSNSKTTENQDYFLDIDGDKGKPTRDILKCASNYLHVVLVCDERDENLQNVMLNSETEMIFKKGLGIHDAFKEIKTHHLFGKGTLFIILCGIQTVCNINFRNQVQILGENSKNITKQLILDAKQLQESVVKTSVGSDNVIFTGIIPVDYRSMSRAAKRELLIACLNYNEWVSSQQLEMKCTHWDIVKYWFMLSSDADNDLKLAIKENTIAQDDLSFTQQAKLYRQNVIKEAIAKTWELLKSQDSEKNLKNIDPSIVKEDLRILLKSRKIEIDDQLRNKNDKIRIDITSKTPSLKVAAHGEPFSSPFDKVVIVGNVHYKSLLKKLAMDIPQMEVLADSSYDFHKDLKSTIEYIEKHKYIGVRNTLWILTSDVSCITHRESHSSCQYYGCRTPISYLNKDARWYTEGEENAKISMRNEAHRISNSGRRFRDKMRKLFDHSCAVILCPPLPATVYISPYPLKESNAHPQLHNALSYFIGFENDVDIIEESFLEPLMHFYSHFNMEWLNLACEILLEENMCSSNLVEYKGIQGDSIQVMSLQMNNESYRTWINIMSEIICSALTKAKIRTGATEPSEIIKAQTLAEAELEYNAQNCTPVVTKENKSKRTNAVGSLLEKPVPQDMDTKDATSPQNIQTHFQSIALIGTKKNYKTLYELLDHNVKFIEGRLNFDEKSDEFILYQQNKYEGATLWVCLVDFLRLTCLVDSSLCERDRHCMQPLRILKLKDNEESEVDKAEKFVSRMIPKLNKGSAIILAPLAPSQVVLESYFKNHPYIHTFREKSEVPIIVGDKENWIKPVEEYEKNWLTMIHSVCCCQKVLGNYENALEEYCKYKGPLVDIIESQYLHHKALNEWVEFIEALLIYFKELKSMEGNGSLSDDKLSLNNSRMETRTMENEQDSSRNEICEPDLLNRSTTEINSLITTASSSKIKAIGSGATCILKSSKDEIVTEKSVDPNSSKASKLQSDKTNTKSLENSKDFYTNESNVNNSKDLESSKEELNKKDKRFKENCSSRNRNEYNLNREKDLKNSEDGQVKESKLKNMLISNDTHLIRPLGETVVPQETLVKPLNDSTNKVDKDDKESSQQFNISKPVSEINESINKIRDEGVKHADKGVSHEKDNTCRIKKASDKSQTVSPELENSKNLLKSNEPSELHKNTSTKLCTVDKAKDGDKESKILSKSKPVTITPQYNSTVQTMYTNEVKVSSNIKTLGSSKVKLSGIHESINDEMVEKLLKACGPIISFQINIQGFTEVICDDITATRVARIFNQRSVNNKTIEAHLIKEGSRGKEKTLPKLTDIEESFEDREAIKKIEEILNKQNNILPLKFQPRSLSLTSSTSPDKSVIKKDLLEKSSVNESKVTKILNKENHNNKIVTDDEVSGDCSFRIENRSIIENKVEDENKKKKSSKDIRQSKNGDVISQNTPSSNISPNREFEKELLNVGNKVEKRKYSKENHNDRIVTGENSAEKKVSSLNESQVNDGKRRRSRSRSQSPYKRSRRKSSGSQIKERKTSETELTTELMSNIQESALLTRAQSPNKRSRRKSSGSHSRERKSSRTELLPELISNVQETTPLSRLRSDHCEESFEDDPILKGLPDGFRSQLDDIQWKEFVSKLKTQYNRHRADYDEYYQDPEMHDEYDQKRDSFMQMLEKEKSNALQEEKDELWNEFWKVELINCDEIKWKQWKNRFIKVTLKKAHNSSKSNCVQATPTSSKVGLNKNVNKNLALKEITVIDLEETVKVKSEPVDIVNTDLIKVKEENTDSLENTAARLKVKNNIKIENDKTELGTSIKNESFFDIPIPPLNLGSEAQIDPEAFVKDLDFLQNEYVAIGDEEDKNSSEISTRIISDTSESSGRLMNLEFDRSPSTSSLGRIRSPEFNFGEKQEFYLKKEKNFDEYYSNNKKQFVNHKEDFFLNVNSDKNVDRFNEFPNHQTDCLPNHQSESLQNQQSEDIQNHQIEGLPNHQFKNTNTGLTEQDINPKEKFKVKDALNTIQSISNRLLLLGPILNAEIDKIKSQPTDSVKELEHLQDKNFLLLLRASATAFEKESEKINDDIVKCLLDVGRKQALELIKYAKSIQSVCVHGVNIENIAKRTIDKTAKECRQFIETAIMYETNSSDKPSENVVKEIYSKISEMHYKMLSVRDTNKGNLK